MSVNRRRLVCPSCGAKYEVDASLIPPAGRDVQCSNCGRTWFEPFEEPESAKPEPVPEPVIEAPAAETPAPAPEPEKPDVKAAPPPPPPPVDLPPEPEDEDEPPPEPGKEIEFPTPPHIAESVRDMLKSEAERETIARADEPADDNWGKRRTSPLRDKMTKARATDGPMPEDAAMANAVAGLHPTPMPASPDPMKAAPRRDRLPDVEEINSSLQASQNRYTDGLLSPEERGESRRGGFRSGFFLVVTLALLAVVVYALSDLIADQVPQVKEPLDAYVAWVDAVRAKLDETVRGWLGQGTGSSG